MNIREHAKPRFVQRVLGIEGYAEANMYAQKNGKEVSKKILDFFNKSKVLHLHYAPTRKESMSYYINEDFIIIVKDRTNEIDTIYRITLLKDRDENLALVQRYRERIQANLNKVKRIEIVKQEQDKRSLELEIDKDYSTDSLAKFYESIQLCKSYAEQQKRLRTENRELMTRLFRKLDEQKEVYI